MDGLVASDPLYAERVRDSFQRQNAMRFIGASLVRVEPGYAEIELPYRDELTQQHKFFHGGITTMIADSAGGYAAYSLFPADASVLTVEFKMSLLAPAAGEKLVASARVVKPGRTLTLCDVEVHAVEGEKRTLVLKGLETLICLHGKADR
ncbi:MAG: PaaI family thioesterase [Reyranellaceae bacterium]